ncbi:hypothetical protein [Pleurocapsa sp. PCC 7319]|uniref:hypothetical protein n=1 Tax=Pleurocapsa sp. PCC 7319 TaxID=118161 RepID=UPI000370D997|nr:hypothetical protein [Pleurocapsa sp. PCC 7319]
MSSDRFTPHQKLIIQRAILFAEMIRELFLLFVPPYVGCRRIYISIQDLAIGCATAESDRNNHGMVKVGVGFRD